MFDLAQSVHKNVLGLLGQSQRSFTDDDDCNSNSEGGSTYTYGSSSSEEEEDDPQHSVRRTGISPEDNGRMLYLAFEVSGDEALDPHKAVHSAVKQLLNTGGGNGYAAGKDENEIDRLIRQEIQNQMKNAGPSREEILRREAEEKAKKTREEILALFVIGTRPQVLLEMFPAHMVRQVMEEISQERKNMNQSKRMCQSERIDRRVSLPEQDQKRMCQSERLGNDISESSNPELRTSLPKDESSKASEPKDSKARSASLSPKPKDSKARRVSLSPVPDKEVGKEDVGGSMKDLSTSSKSRLSSSKHDKSKGSKSERSNRRVSLPPPELQEEMRIDLGGSMKDLSSTSKSRSSRDDKSKGSRDSRSSAEKDDRRKKSSSDHHHHSSKEDRRRRSSSHRKSHDDGRREQRGKSSRESREKGSGSIDVSNGSRKKRSEKKEEMQKAYNPMASSSRRLSETKVDLDDASPTKGETQIPDSDATPPVTQTKRSSWSLSNNRLLPKLEHDAQMMPGLSTLLNESKTPRHRSTLSVSLNDHQRSRTTHERRLHGSMSSLGADSTRPESRTAHARRSALDRRKGTSKTTHQRTSIVDGTTDHSRRGSAFRSTSRRRSAVPEAGDVRASSQRPNGARSKSRTRRGSRRESRRRLVGEEEGIPDSRKAETRRIASKTRRIRSKSTGAAAGQRAKVRRESVEAPIMEGQRRVQRRRATVSERSSSIPPGASRTRRQRRQTHASEDLQEDVQQWQSSIPSTVEDEEAPLTPRRRRKSSARPTTTPPRQNELREPSHGNHKAREAGVGDNRVEKKSKKFWKK